MFVATLYTSDSDKIMRYTDEVSIVFVGGSRTPEVHLLTECCSHRLLSTHLSFFFLWVFLASPSARTGRDPGTVQVDCRLERLAEFPTAREHAPAQRLLHWYARRRCSPFLCCILTSLHLSEFELGLELDSAEVRGVLIFEGQDWGHVVFDFRA